MATVPAVSYPLRNSKFRSLWIGASLSWFGDQFYLVTLPWLILRLTRSGIVLGLILMMAAIPRSVLMLMGGAVSDRISPRKVMIVATVVRTVLVAITGTLVWAHRLQLWHLYLLSITFGIADAFVGPAAQSYLPSLVEPQQLTAANSISQGTMQLITIVGPVPAGLIVKVMGAAWAFFIDAFSFLFVIVALWRLPDPPYISQSQPRKNIWADILDGIKVVSRDISLRSLFLFAAILNFFVSGPIAVGLPYLIKRNFASPAIYGTAVSAVAAGGLLGMLLAGMLRQGRRGVLLIGMSAIVGLCTVVVGYLHSLWGLLGILAVMGAAAGFSNVHILSWYQERVAVEVRGRTMSVLMFATSGLLPFSLATAGMLVQQNLQLMFVFSGAAVLLVTGFAVLNTAIREIR